MLPRAWSPRPRGWPGAAEQAAVWCARTSHAVAVEQGGRRCTYRNLEEKAATVVGALERAGARPGTVVAVMGPKGGAGGTGGGGGGGKVAAGLSQERPVVPN
ncbi:MULTISPECIES: hypothetical protein [unclassified Streptomyces]|uniref:hypothetical protein n=1 Tax=unclassified Streptomyces TaxID=2593676 RepID=UPI00130131CE|nr:hypothetical protein [Streptomyces sp. TSRI0281]